MKHSQLFAILLTSLLFFSPCYIYAQTACTYQLQLNDSFGDGWDDSFVSISINGESNRYTLGDGDDDMGFQVIELLLVSGDSIVLRYGAEGTPTFLNEISFRLIDADGFVSYEGGPSPELGETFATLVTCPKCAILLSDDIQISDETATTALLSLNKEEGEQVVVEVGPRGFEEGMGEQRRFTENEILLDGLSENTQYDVYLSRICVEGENSSSIGPFSFRTPFLNPPDTCFYTLRMIDFFGDGWNGTSVSITVNDVSTEYTLSDGSFEEIFIPALQNLPFQLDYNAGLFDEEISYVLLDPTGNIIYSDGPNATPGRVVDLIACPSCPVPNMPTLDIAATSATANWEPLPAVQEYVLEYGLAGFELGTGLEVITNQASEKLTDLEENTAYEYYFYTTCPEDEKSIQTLGPIPFQTRFKNDVGIEAITMPTTTCGLGVSEMIEIQLKNYGANPQSLITYKFSINGLDGGVPVPTDGFFTGIISKDSIASIQFETPANLMNTGIYDIAVWTELESEGNTSNDTATVMIANIPTIQDFPYSEDFSKNSGGWTIGAESTNASWEFGTPNSDELARAFSNQKVWATNLDGPYNVSETSFLVSPCLDFSSLEYEPMIGFRYFMDAPDLADSDTRVYLEMSLDGGRWQRIGEEEDALNWYNNDLQTAWVADASLGTWRYAEHRLPNTVGVEDVRLRFVFITDEAQEAAAGFAIDDIHIFLEQRANSVARLATNNSFGSCGAATDSVSLLVRNSSLLPVSQLIMGYRVDDGPIIQEQLDTLFRSKESIVYTFQTPFNSTEVKSYRIQAWLSELSDGVPISDTTYFHFEVLPPNPLPLLEDFDDEEVDEGWVATIGSPTFTEPMSHNNETTIISDNMWFGNDRAEFVTASYGPINAGDSLHFDYRLAAWPDASIAHELEGDTLELAISTDCGATYQTIYTIHQGNHTPTAAFTTATIPLDAYEGMGVAFKLLMKWGDGDYWFDIDNIQILSCPSTLNLTAQVTDATGEEMADGSIQIIPLQGSGGYIYTWPTSLVDTDSLGGLLPGSYQVAVTDALLGCQDSITVEVGILSTSTEALPLVSQLNLYPNPTNSTAHLHLELYQPAALTLSIFNIVGQTIQMRDYPSAAIFDVDLPLTELPKGIYWVRLNIGTKQLTRKLIKVE